MEAELYFKPGSARDLENLPHPEEVSETEIRDSYLQDLEDLEERKDLNFEQIMDQVAEDMAYAIGRGFRLHDQGEMDKALKCFAYVDINQGVPWEAASFYNRALEKKDEIEMDNLAEEVEEEELETVEADPQHFNGPAIYEDPRWEEIEDLFRKRAETAAQKLDWSREKIKSEIIEPYGRHYTEFWKKHKLTEEDLDHLELNSHDYSENVLESMKAMLKAVTGGEYPDKPTSGKGGPGVIPSLYLSAFNFYLNGEQKQANEIMKVHYSSFLEYLNHIDKNRSRI